MNPPEYTPDEAALKAEIESLAQNIQPNTDFVADLEAQLMRREAMASTKPIRKQEFNIRYVLQVAALMLIFLVLLMIFPFILLNSDNEEMNASALTATAITQNNSQIQTQVAGTEIAIASNPTITSTPTQTSIPSATASPTQFSATLMVPIRSTSTPFPSATPLATALPASPTPAIRMTATIPKPTEISSVSIQKFWQQVIRWLVELLNRMNFSLF